MPSIEEPPFTPEWRRAHAALGDAYLSTVDKIIEGPNELTSEQLTALTNLAQAHYMAASLKG